MPQGRYYLAGYPIALTKTDHTPDAKSITVAPYTFATHLADSENAHSGISIVLANTKESFAIDADGDVAPSPDLHGVSGCGIWRLWANEEFERIAQWDESWIRLVGIDHRTSGETIIGTMIRHVVRMMIETQPSQLTISDQGATIGFP
jgi:hypothetical protein